LNATTQPPWIKVFIRLSFPAQPSIEKPILRRGLRAVKKRNGLRCPPLSRVEALPQDERRGAHPPRLEFSFDLMVKFLYSLPLSCYGNAAVQSIGGIAEAP
jgi:hypothetical protein